jgi:hypothetical protein
MLLLLNCTSTELVDSWKNPAIEFYAPYKVLVVGMTSNTEARLKFEQQLKNELELRGINAMMSLELLDPSLRTEKMTQEELKEFENKLSNDGFDTVLFSKVIGVEDKVAYKKSYYNYEETYRRFKDDYLMYQDIYYNPEYYDEYTVYHAETSLYCICPTKDRELIWKGYIDIIDPQSIEETVNDYVNLVLLVLEKETLINQKLLKEELIEM